MDDLGGSNESLKAKERGRTEIGQIDGTEEGKMQNMRDTQPTIVALKDGGRNMGSK